MAKGKVWVFCSDEREAVRLAEAGCGYDSLEGALVAALAEGFTPPCPVKLFEVEVDIRMTAMKEVQPK